MLNPTNIADKLHNKPVTVSKTVANYHIHAAQQPIMDMVVLLAQITSMAYVTVVVHIFIIAIFFTYTIIHKNGPPFVDIIKYHVDA